jgi:UDPglucose 6-dehydrogenase
MINARQRDTAVAMIREITDSLEDAKVAVLGLAFKPETDDLRGAPAIAIIERLLDDDVRVSAHDPVAARNAERLLPKVEYAPDAYAAIADADVVLLATEWPEYVTLDWARVRDLMRGNTVIDGRNVLKQAELNELGFRYLAFGRGHEPRLVEMHRAAETAVERPASRKSADRVRVAETAA